MNYSEFIETVRCEVEDIVGKEVNVTAKVHRVTRNNGIELDGLIILEEGYHISPTIYLNDYYERLKEGAEFADIVNEIVKTYYSNKDKLMLSEDFFSSYESVKERIIYKVINYNQNLKLLKNVPHIKKLDLAIVFCCLVDSGEGISATAMINNEHLKLWNVSREDVINSAFRNTPKLFQCEVRSMDDIIRELLIAEMANNSGLSRKEYELEEMADEVIEGMKNDNNGILMYVLTNNQKTGGASCMFYNGVLEKFADEINSDLYILPSSIHEVILVPVNEYTDKKDLTCMVKEVNEQEVDECDRLSDNVYMYKRHEGALVMA